MATLEATKDELDAAVPSLIMPVPVYKSCDCIRRSSELELYKEILKSDNNETYNYVQ